MVIRDGAAVVGTSVIRDEVVVDEEALAAAWGEVDHRAVRVGASDSTERAAPDGVIRGLTTEGTYDEDFLDGLGAGCARGAGQGAATAGG